MLKVPKGFFHLSLTPRKSKPRFRARCTPQSLPMHLPRSCSQLVHHHVSPQVCLAGGVTQHCSRAPVLLQVSGPGLAGVEGCTSLGNFSYKFSQRKVPGDHPLGTRFPVSYKMSCLHSSPELSQGFLPGFLCQQELPHHAGTTPSSVYTPHLCLTLFSHRIGEAMLGRTSLSSSGSSGHAKRGSRWTERKGWKGR